MKIKIDFGNRFWMFSFINLKKPSKWTTGVMSKLVNSNLFCVIADFDATPLAYLIDEAKYLQEAFNLSNLHIFESSKRNYHLVGFDTMMLKEYLFFLNSTSCDFAFLKVPQIHIRNWVLRNFEKGKTPAPKYIITLERKPEEPRLQSTAHYDYFCLLYPELKKFKLDNPDGKKKIRLISYQTGMNI